MAVLVGALSEQFSPDLRAFDDVQHMAIAHRALEMFSTLLSAMVIVVSWHTLDSSNARESNVVIFGFTLIAANHALQALVPEGWASAIPGRGGTAVTILWLAPRFAEWGGLLATANRARLPGSAFFWLIAALLVSAGGAWLTMMPAPALPGPFAAVQDVLSFEASRWLLISIDLAGSVWLLSRYARSSQEMQLDFAAALFLMAAGEWCYVPHAPSESLTVVLGHFYTILAFGIVFNAIFKAVLSQPYRKIIESEKLLASKKNELEVLLRNVPVTVMCLDRDLRYRYVNNYYQSAAVEGLGPVIGMPLNFSNRVGDINVYKSHLDRALSGERREFDVDFANENGETHYRSIIMVPDRTADEDIQGVLVIVIDVTDRVRAQNLLIKSQREMEHMAYHDALTGLPNRRLMHDRLDRAVADAARQGHYGALLLLDVDYFKEINDTLGHVVGDELLQTVASRLRESVGGDAGISRLGGDEFVVILGDIGTYGEDARAYVDGICARIRAAVAAPCTLAEHVVTTTLTIGAVLFHQASDRPDELLKQADIALYKAKADGRNRVLFFVPSLQADVTARAELLRDLQQASVHDQLFLHYQPIVDADLRILGVEALVRWMHPVRGLIPPDDFIPLAEQGNLISVIGQYVLETACAQLRIWADDAVRSSWTISVNVSARQFHEGGFVANVERALAKAGANPGLLYLELTESILHDDLDLTKAKMMTLRSRGVRFSLDDFGTGYSSLRYLKQLPLDQLKIDKSFIRDALSDDNSAAIVKITLSLAQNLDLRVVAEGVETIEQFDLLVAHRCPAFQGYLFCRPVAVSELADAIAPIDAREQAGALALSNLPA